MTGDISYAVRCAKVERLALGKLRSSGGCGDAPLDRRLALRGLISCPGCGLEWPDVRIVATYPPGFGDAPAAVAPRAAAPAGPAQGTLI